MKLKIIGHEDLYAVEQLQMALFSEKILAGDGEAVSCLHRGKTYLTAVTTITLNGKTTKGIRRLRAHKETVRLRRWILQQSYYLAACRHLDYTPAWGALAGVRPTKLTTRHLLRGGTTVSANKLLRDVYFVTEPRRELAIACSQSAVAAYEKTEPNDISLYIGIPFCPTRCTYCSFVSRSIGKRTELLQPYLQALEKELEATGQLLKQYGRRVRTVYMGGGTPTTLSAQQIGDLLNSVYKHIDLSACLEFTVEGGRPDTLTEEKLRLIRSAGANRMSINPQSMEDTVLRACGRPHTAEDVIRSFRHAEKAGFDAINMDLIAGLPQDSFDGFCRSLNALLNLQPANITVHTLALKKGADLFEKQESLPDGQTVAHMVSFANTQLEQGKYKPYYLYRQKYMSGSFENIGWSRDNQDCLYNIYMMEELHTIVSLGGGGMNKANLPDGTLKRFHNPKFPEQYISQLDSVLRQKEELFCLL